MQIKPYEGGRPIKSYYDADEVEAHLARVRAECAALDIMAPTLVVLPYRATVIPAKGAPELAARNTPKKRGGRPKQMKERA